MTRTLLLNIFLLSACQAFGQTFLMNGSPIASCSGVFYDSGGNSGNYANNQTLNTTICPDGTGNTHIQLTFDQADLAPGDQLCIYDGPNVAALLLTCLPSSLTAGTFVVQATPANTTGCLTLAFSSNASGTGAGWQAMISCINPCPFPAPTGLQVVSMQNGNMVWLWNAVPGSLGYEVSLNGGPWIPANGNLSHTVSGLMPGDLVVLEVRAINGAPGCTSASITGNKIYVNCSLAGGIGSLTPAKCTGTPTGSAVITASGPQGAVEFFLDNNTAPFSSGNFANMLSAGNHTAVLRDAAGCLDTVAFAIVEPAPLQLSIAATDAECFGDNSGKMQAAGSGGTPPYQYVWQPCQGGFMVKDSVAPDLFAGCYAVTITDANGCTATGRDTIGEPEMFHFSSIQDSVNCFGGTDGKATVMVSGAMPPYAFKWSNGDISQTADSLKAGFHSVTITDKVGCQAVTLVQVLQPPKLVIDSISVVNLACFGGNTGKATVIAKGGTKPYSYAWSNSLNGQMLTGLSAGPYTVTLTDWNNCVISLSAVISTPPELLVQINDLQGETCAGTCDGRIGLGLSGGTPPYTISWSDPGIPPGTIAPQNLCPGDYQATVTDAKGCTATTTANILPAIPVVLQVKPVDPLCANDQNGSVGITANGGTTPFQFKWSNGSTANPILNLPCGMYTVTVTDGLGCTQTASATLACPPALQILSMTPQAARCFGEANGQILVAAQGGTGTLLYTWSDPNQQSDPTAENLPAGIYTVTVNDANGCSSSASTSVAQPPALKATTTVTHVNCFGGNSGTATAMASGGTPPYGYTWSVPQSTPTITALTAGTYFLTVSDANGCTLIAPPAVVTQPATNVTVTATQTQFACFGADNGAALAVASGGNGTPFGYNWSGGFSGPNPVNLTAGLYTVTATDPKGCTGTASTTVQERLKIEIGLAQVSPKCAGGADGQATINKVSGGAGNGIFANYHYQWSIPGVGDTLYVNGLIGGQDYTVTVTDNTGCSAQLTFKLADPPPIAITLTSDSTSCAGRFDGAVRVANLSSPRPVVQYAWSNNSAGTSLQNVPAGFYAVTVTDAEGCTGTASALVHEPPPLALDVLVQSLICNSDSNGVLQANPTGGTPGYTYAWSTGAVTKSISGLGPAIYTVTVSDRNGCATTISTTLTQPNPPSIQVDKKEPSCFGAADGYLQFHVTGAAPPYRYSLDGKTFTSKSVFLGLYAGQYYAYVLDGMGCTTSVPILLTEPQPVKLLLGTDTTLVLGESLTLNAIASNGATPYMYDWSSALTDTIICVDDPACSTVKLTPNYSNTFQVTVTDAHGCTGEASIRIDITKPRGAYVPTGFSPNGDGNNDLLVVHGKAKQIRKVRIFRVFDRWGELVHEDIDFAVNDLQRGWDGRFRQEEAPSGVYVWYLEVEYLDGYIEASRGNTTLIR